MQFVSIRIKTVSIADLISREERSMFHRITRLISDISLGASAEERSLLHEKQDCSLPMQFGLRFFFHDCPARPFHVDVRIERPHFDPEAGAIGGTGCVHSFPSGARGRRERGDLLRNVVNILPSYYARTTARSCPE